MDGPSTQAHTYTRLQGTRRRRQEQGETWYETPPRPARKHAHALTIGDGHEPRGNNGVANEYVKNAREGAKGTDRARKHKRTQGRKIQEDGDKTKEKHGMKPHPRPTHKQAHAFSIGDHNKKLHKV